MAEPRSSTPDATENGSSTPTISSLATFTPTWRPPAWLMWGAFGSALAVAPAHLAVLWLGATTPSRSFDSEFWYQTLTSLVVTQVGLAVVAGGCALWRSVGTHRVGNRAPQVAVAVTSLLIGVLAPIWYFAVAIFWAFLHGFATGGAWGRPLRIQGRAKHPELREGTDWARGELPDVSSLKPPTRRALEALWLHDAQKEHASVPAFSRISWMLAAVGAPPELMLGASQAALEEIDHAQRCFALAAGYGGRVHTVEPMPELLISGSGLQVDASPLEVLARESLKDGCLLEDFNADVAAACALRCEEPVVRDVLSRIAREERSHADFSWVLLTWTLERGGPELANAVRDEAAALHRVPRPTATSAKTHHLVIRADADALLRHGRLPDVEWLKLWKARLSATTERVEHLLTQQRHRATSQPFESQPLSGGGQAA